MTLRARVEKLAPTGEGLVRTREGVGLVEGALPGEEVDVEIVRVSSKIWRGRVSAVHVASPARRSGGHANGCPACDWAHFEPAAALVAKRELFLETMSRIGRLPAELFGALPIEASPPGYRLRSRFKRGGIHRSGFQRGRRCVLPELSVLLVSRQRDGAERWDRPSAVEELHCSGGL
jgi:23S rRNA (uracil1939-C5)-methyltransferase